MEVPVLGTVMKLWEKHENIEHRRRVVRLLEVLSLDGRILHGKLQNLEQNVET
jgi:hypothetical protein